MKDPEQYLRHLGVHLDCPVETTHTAILDAALRAYVNHEIFFFSSKSARMKFLKEPLKYCGLLTDPITGKRFRPTASSPRFEHGGRPYFFTSAETKDRFKKEPERFANPKRKMPEPAASATQPTDPATQPASGHPEKQ